VHRETTSHPRIRFLHLPCLRRKKRIHMPKMRTLVRTSTSAEPGGAQRGCTVRPPHTPEFDSSTYLVLGGRNESRGYTVRPPRSAVLLAETRAVAAALAEEVERDIHSRAVDVLLKRLRTLAAATVAAARDERRVFRNKPEQQSPRLGSRHLPAVMSASSKSTGPAGRRPHRQGGS
jgi:hypothetical protein